MALRNRLDQQLQNKKVAWNTLELDYALSWVLAGVGAEPEAREHLIFKGGTCLKKCYFGEHYRFSEDLDFTTAPEISDDLLDQWIYQVVTKANEISRAEGSGVEYHSEPYPEKEPHPFNQRAYLVRAKFPWHREPLTKIKLEISRDESLVFPSQEKRIIHEYGETIPGTARVYALEEIVAEKYRGILQNQERLKAKGWVRSRVRDFYDLWRILTQFKDEINFIGFKEAFIQKCIMKGIAFQGAEQFFNYPDYLARVERDWQQYLQRLVVNFPSFSETSQELKTLTLDVFKDQ